MGIVPIDLQTQGSWEQLFRGNYSKGLRTFKSILAVPELAAQMVNDAQALNCIYTDINFSNATGLLAKAIGATDYALSAFNTFCGVCGVPIKETFELTCADAAAKEVMLGNKSIMYVIINTPALKAIFGDIAAEFTLDNIRKSIRGGWYTEWTLGSTVNIPLSQFVLGSTTFAAATITFELIGIDEDRDADGNILPLTLCMKDLHYNNFVMYSANSNVFKYCYPYTQNTNIANALPAEWRSCIADTYKQVCENGSNTNLVSESFPVFLLKSYEVFGTGSNARAEENAVSHQYSGFAKGIASKVKKMNNGAGSANFWWLWSPYSGNATNFCLVNSDGNASNNAASTSNGLCFGFALKHDI